LEEKEDIIDELRSKLDYHEKEMDKKEEEKRRIINSVKKMEEEIEFEHKGIRRKLMELEKSLKRNGRALKENEEEFIKLEKEKGGGLKEHSEILIKLEEDIRQCQLCEQNIKVNVDQRQAQNMGIFNNALLPLENVQNYLFIVFINFLDKGRNRASKIHFGGKDKKLVCNSG